MACCFGTDYSATYGSQPLVPQRPGTLNVLNHPQLFVPQEVYLVMRGRLMSWSNSSDISYHNGPPYARVRGRAFSMNDKHTIECLDGTPLLNVKRPAFGFSRSFEMYYGDDSRQLAATIKVMTWGAANVKLGVFLPGQNGSDPVVVIKGNGFRGEYYGFIGNPKQGGAKILSVTRTGMAGMLGGAISFHVAIAANVDIGLMLAVVTALDEMESENASD